MPDYKAVKRSVSFAPSNLEKAQQIADQRLGGNLSRLINDLLSQAQGATVAATNSTPVQDLIDTFAPAWRSRAEQALEGTNEAEFLTKLLIAGVEAVEKQRLPASLPPDYDDFILFLQLFRKSAIRRDLTPKEQRYIEEYIDQEEPAKAAEPKGSYHANQPATRKKA